MSLVFADSASGMNFFNNKDKVGSSIILLTALIYLNATFNIPINQLLGGEVFTARTLPIWLSIITIVVCLIQIFVHVRGAVDETLSCAFDGFQWRPYI